MKVYSYVRVSTSKQADKDGPIRQRAAIKEFCAKHILEDCGEFFEDVSGTVEGVDRPQFASMLQRIEDLRLNNIQVEGFVVESMNRLARDLMVSELLLKVCRERSIRVFTCESGVLQDATADQADPSRVLIRQIMGAVAEFMKSELVKKMASARARIRAEKGRCEGEKPYGEKPGEKIVRDLIISLYNNMEWKPARIAKALNGDGHKTRHGLDWTKDTVYKVLLPMRKKNQ